MKLLLSTLGGGNPLNRNSIEGVYKRLQKIIEYAWIKPDVSLGFVELMRQALPFNSSNIQELNKITAYWALLPGLCCKAAGGSVELADPVAAAWIVFYLAAHIMDNVQDDDIPDPWWAKLGSGIAINVASGLFFTANTILFEMFNQTFDPDVVKQIINFFNYYLLNMCDGQHQDLDNSQGSLDKFWEISSRKSGSFFTLACQSGARLATNQKSRVSEFGRFGYHLGMIIQVLDELEDWYVFTTGKDIRRIKRLSMSLPILYTLQVVPDTAQIDLKKKIIEFTNDPTVVDEINYEIERSGASVYILTELERHNHLARIALENANPEPHTGNELLALIDPLINKIDSLRRSD
jgi:geranylgeranyl pyrophosphate synthase